MHGKGNYLLLIVQSMFAQAAKSAQETNAINNQVNKCSERSMEVKPALLGNYDRPTDRQTERAIGK